MSTEMKALLRTLILALLSWAILPTTAEAQQPPAQQQQQPTNRNRRLREHEQKIQEIIQQRRTERDKREAEERTRQAAAPTDPAEQKQKDSPKPPSSVVMGFKFLNQAGVSDYNTIVSKGDTFLSEVLLFNVDQNSIDRISLALQFDKRFIEPVRIFDTQLAPYIDGNSTFRIDERDSILIYEARLQKPATSTEVVLLKILWKAVRPTPYTGIEFKFSPLERPQDPHTAIYVAGVNILGIRDDPQDGVLSGGLMIEDPAAPKELQGKATELRDIYLGSVASDATVGLQIVGPEDPVRLGDRFVVRVRLNNPDGALVDSVNYFILFDPKVLQVIDEDKFNWMLRGVNVHDGPYHLNFPWDMHKQNEVRNERGQIVYSMALSNGAALPSRTFTDIHFRAVAPTAETPIGFVKRRPGAPNLTSVRYFGYELLDLATQISTPSINVTILNPPVEVALPRDETEPPPPQAPQAAESSVRALLIER